MNKSKLLASKALLKSKLFLLITNTDAYMYGDFDNLEGYLALNALRESKKKITEIIKNIESESKTNSR
jgi:hypothetical protein